MAGYKIQNGVQLRYKNKQNNAKETNNNANKKPH